MIKFLSTVDHGGLRDTNAATPTSSGDLATKGYTDGGFQPLDSDLTAIAALAPADGSLLGRAGGAWVGRSPSNAKTDLSLDKVLNIKHNITATTNPGTGDDNTTGYSVGSHWFNTTLHTAYYCVDAATGAALWIKINFVSSVAFPLVESGGGVSITAGVYDEPPTVGYMPYAMPLGAAGTGTLSANDSMVAAGGTRLLPMEVRAQMTIESLSIRNGDTTLARSWEWRLFREPAGGSATLAEIANAHGSESFTATAASIRTAAAAAAFTIEPGYYWLAIRNTHASNAFTIVAVSAFATTNLTMGGTVYMSKTIGSALTTTLDAVTGWTKLTTILPGARLNGRVFAQGSIY